ncbi:MAG TPA: cytochrome b/b6 domain-containing protein [Dongiaceae bacterium]|jgi:cytochrome b561
MTVPIRSKREAHTREIREIYDTVTIGLHWATAALVAILWLMGRTTGFLPRGPLRVDVWSVHVLLGFTLAGIIIARIFWRSFFGRRLPPADRGMLQRLAATVHYLLYALLLTVAALGVTNVFAHAFPLFNLWHFPEIGSGNFASRINGWHSLAANIIAAVAVGHAAAALFHHYVIKDKVLGRMWPSAPADTELSHGETAGTARRSAE